MKATAIAAVGLALLGILCCQPAEAKLEDFNTRKLKVTTIKSGWKIKAKKQVSRVKALPKKPVLGGKLVTSKTVKATAERKSPLPAPASQSSRPKPPKSDVAKLVAKPGATTRKPTSMSKAASFTSKLAARWQNTAGIEMANDGLPPYVRANRQRLDLDKRVEVAAMIASMAPCQKVPVWFALRVAMTESSLNAKARGGAGEIGLFQMKCATARYLGFTGDCEGLYDARTNIYWGLKHLSRALQFSDGDTRHAASKHNGGLGTKILRTDYVKQVMCSSARSGFPSAYQLGASTDILRLCGKTKGRPKKTLGFYDKKDLLTSSIAEIGFKTASTAPVGPSARAARECDSHDFGRSPSLASPTDAKTQQKPAKRLVESAPVQIIGSLNPIYPPR